MTWQLASTLLVLAALAAGAGWWERRRPTSKLLALAAALAALAVAGRVLFAPIPNVQATTDVVLLSGYCLGAGPGFAVGALGALGSNFFLGQGPWTPWQMLGWGGVGIAGAGLARALSPRRGPAALDTRLRRWLAALACGLAGLAFGAWMDLFTLVTFAAESSTDTYFAIAATSLPFNIAHALGNVLLCLLLGPGFVRLLLRFRQRFEIRWGPPTEPARPRSSAATRTAAIGLLLALAGGSALVAAEADAATGQRAAVRYLERAQNRDGGFGAAPGEASSQIMTGWAVIGLEAARRNPLDLRRAGRTPIDFMRLHARALSDTGELERTILALRAAGLSPRRFDGRDLVAELLRRRRTNGSFEGQVNLTAFAILALRSAGRPPGSAVLRKARRWIVEQQNGDGGFSFAGRGGASDVDDTGAVLQALALRGGGQVVHRDAVERAIGYLRRSQNADGGLGQMTGSRSNAQSTAWAIQGLVAAGRDPARFERGGRSPLVYLRSLQAEDGSFRYSRGSAQTPVWVTATALPAILRRPLPVAPVGRLRGSGRGAGRAEAGRPNAAAARRRSAKAAAHAPGAPRRRRSVPNAVAASGATRSAAYPVTATGAQQRDQGSSGRFPLLEIALVAAGAGLVAFLLRRRRTRRA